MKILINAQGSQGDIRPMLALCKGLIKPDIMSSTSCLTQNVAWHKQKVC